MNTKKYNTQELIPPEAEMEIESYFGDSKVDEELVKEDEKILDYFSKIKTSHRKRRKDARKAKAHQVKLATSLAKQNKNKRKSLYRWSPIWHKMKLSDVSPKKQKNHSSNASTLDALKEYKSITT